jgi:hypothetical protein
MRVTDNMPLTDNMLGIVCGCVCGDCVILQERMLHDGADNNWRSAFYMPAQADTGW